MSKIYYLLILFFSFSVISAQEKLSKEEKARREKNIQAGNPFAKYGSKAPVATLSKGKYLEVHDLDSIVTIGTSRWHVDNKKIVGDIVFDSLNVDAQPIGDRAGRWMSPDPLGEEFPSWSPYNMCYNNPVRYVDPDGRAADDLILKFHGDNSKAKTQAVLDEGLGKGVAKIDDNGKVTLNGKCEDLKTEAQRGLFDVLSKPVNSEQDTTIDVYDNDKSFFGGDYKHGKIDIGDINNFGTGELDNKFTSLGHEINEQFEYQSGNKLDYFEPNSSHMNSIKVEATINGGWTRGRSEVTNFKRYQINIPAGLGTRKVWTMDATYNTPFTKGNETRIFSYQVKEFNVIPIK